MKPPDSAPALAKMAALKAKFEADREIIFPRWKAALEAAQGNVTRASIDYVRGPGTVEDRPISRALSKDERQRIKNYGGWLTRTLGLRAYAGDLRVRAGQGKRGRPWPKKAGKSKDKVE